MASRTSEAARATDAAARAGQTELFKLGQEQSEALLHLQEEIFHVYEEASQAWLERVKAEVDLWSDLAAKLTASRSVPDALSAYQRCVAERMEMAAEDGRRMTTDVQKIMSKITHSMPNGLRSVGK
jgi:Phasin protein